jgi:uncharacterized paraquat-inducible protein A
MSTAKLIARAFRMNRVKDNLVLCDNCDTPASMSLSKALSSAVCAPCATGEADSFDASDLIAVPEPKI